ncbi:MAG: ABC transporter permease subunit [Patescibacteria group bacterium]|nr:ABC transporter permease subunit [Patescibacteria group bacterium]MDE2116612.1 ABC transporter permease subunit [Patescibacteria group bacterium]
MARHPAGKHRYHHHSEFTYPTSLSQRLSSIFLLPLVAVLFFGGILMILSHTSVIAVNSVDFGSLSSALGATFLRLLLAYGLSIIFAIPLVLLVNISPRVETLLLPLFDIIESVPILAFFPVVILFFIAAGFSEGAAVFIIFISMLWNIVFSLVGGLKTVPTDIKAAARVFGVRGPAYLFKVLLPSVFPYLVTGSLLAWAQGWNMIIVAEVLHTYLPGGTERQDLFGIGSILVHASTSENTALFIAAISLIIVVIALMNFFIWQKLLKYSERFRFE